MRWIFVVGSAGEILAAGRSRLKASTKRMKFARHDILLAASDVPGDAPLRDLHGPGRLLHLGADFALKRVLWTGTDGLVIGVAFDPVRGDLYCADAQARAVVRFDPAGNRVSLRHPLPARKFGTVEFDADGRCFLGVHNRLGEDESTPAGVLARLDVETGVLQTWPVAIDGGKLKFHCITHMSLTPDQQVLCYVSENGRRVLRFDVGRQRQLEDFLVLPADDPRGTFGIDHLPDGRMLMATGSGASLFDADGSELHRYDVPKRRGWSRLRLSLDGASFFLNNFLDGTIQRRSLASGELLASHNIGQAHALCGLDECP